MEVKQRERNKQGDQDWIDENMNGWKEGSKTGMTERQNKGKNKHANPAFHLQVRFSRPDH